MGGPGAGGLPQGRELRGAPPTLRGPTFLPGRVVGVQAPADRDHLEDQVVPSLADHVHHLPVADLDHVLIVDLRGHGAGRP